MAFTLAISYVENFREVTFQTTTRFSFGWAFTSQRISFLSIGTCNVDVWTLALAVVKFILFLFIGTRKRYALAFACIIIHLIGVMAAIAFTFWLTETCSFILDISIWTIDWNAITSAFVCIKDSVRWARTNITFATTIIHWVLNIIYWTISR